MLCVTSLDNRDHNVVHYQAKEKLITSLQEDHSGGGGVSEAILEQNKMEKRMIEQQLSSTEQQLEQIRTELSVSAPVNSVQIM